GTRLALAGGWGGVQLWDARGSRQLLDLSSLFDAQAEVAVSFSPDGGRLAIATERRAGSESTGELIVCEARTGRLLARHADPSFGFKSVAFSPDGSRLVTGGGARGQPGVVQIWDARALERQLDLRGHTGTVESVSFSQDGCRVASGCQEGAVKIWDARPGRHRAELTTTRPIRCLARSPDDGLIAVAGAADAPDDSSAW